MENQLIRLKFPNEILYIRKTDAGYTKYQPCFSKSMYQTTLSKTNYDSLIEESISVNSVPEALFFGNTQSIDLPQKLQDFVDSDN